MPTLNTGDAELYYEERGHGQPLVMLAGLASDSQSWQAVQGALSRKYRIILPDNRGCGRTRSADATMSLGQMAGDMVSLLDHLGLERAAVLGHSMGGVIALELVRRWPERVSALVLAGTPDRLSPRNRALLRDWGEWARDGIAERMRYHHLFYWLFSESFFDEERQVELAEEYAVACPHAQSKGDFLRQIEALLTYEAPAGPGAHGIPRTLVMAGEKDILFPPTRCRALADLLAGSTYVCLPGAAHALHLEQPERFVQEVCTFLG